MHTQLNPTFSVIYVLYSKYMYTLDQMWKQEKVFNQHVERVGGGGGEYPGELRRVYNLI